MPDKTKIEKAAKPKAGKAIRITKALLLTLWGISLFVVGTFICILTVLTPERLTPIVERIATAQLQHARVEARSIELTAKSSFPFLEVEVRDLKVISSAIDSLAPEAAGSKPQWADTVLSVDAFAGGINLPKLLTGTLEFSDVSITHPAINFVVANEKVTNCSIIPPTSSKKDDEPLSLPELHLKRFTIDAPCPIRYHDITTGTNLTVNFEEAWFDGNNDPRYKLALSGNLSPDMLPGFYLLPRLAFGLSGDIGWNQKTPSRISLDNIDMNIDVIAAKASTAVDFADGLRIDKFDFDLLPVDVARVLKLLPAELKAEYSIPDDIHTNATVAAKLTFTQPYAVGGPNVIPHCTAHLVIPDSKFSWQKVTFDNLALDLSLDIPGDDINSIVVNLNRLNMCGPATDLTISGSVSSLLYDPKFDGTMKGVCHLDKFPPIIAKVIPGKLKGRLTADASIKGRTSMFNVEDYHKLQVNGLLKLDNLSYVASDTTLSVKANHASFDFGTNRSVVHSGHRADSLLQAKISLDSLYVLQDDISLKLGDVSFGLGAVTRSKSSGNKRQRQITPMGGRLSIGSLRMLILSDSIMTSLRDVQGMASVRAHNNDSRTPEFNFDLGFDRFVAGGRSDRIMFRNAHAKFSAWPEPQSRQAAAVKHISDSLARRHPKLSSDSIYALAQEIRREQMRHRSNSRVRSRATADSTEIFDFGIDNGMRRMLTEWRFTGNLSAERAGIFTPYFPLRNRLSNINLTFDNDSIAMRNVRYDCGRSDFAVTGVITNLRRSLTSRSGRQPLKVDFDLSSDTIDINQLVQSMFAGSAYMLTHTELDNGFDLNNENLDEENLDLHIDQQAQSAPDSMAPLLIPTNIEASLDIKAKNVIYSDVTLHDMHGQAITYNGALSLNDLSAKSGIGDVTLQALYMGRQVDSLQFGFGLQANRFNIHRFLDLLPAVDTIMPLLRDFEGIISGDIAATTNLTPNMDFDMSTLRAAMRLSGDTLVLLDPDTFKSLSKWLMFKDKKKNYIDHMSAQMLVENGNMQLFPFIFNIDRYRLGVQGSNDFDLNFKYHIAVLKSPIPFKFGINISGTPDDFKIRLGGAKFDDKTPISIDIVDNTRVNLVNGLRGIFHRGLRNARVNKLKIEGEASASALNLSDGELSHADSLMFIREGLIEAPDSLTATDSLPAADTKHGKKSAKGKDKKSIVMLTLPAPLTLLAIRRRKDDDA